jgi:hypothetical protein
MLNFFFPNDFSSRHKKRRRIDLSMRLLFTCFEIYFKPLPSIAVPGSIPGKIPVVPV